MMIEFLHFSFKLCSAAAKSEILPAAFIVAALNMSTQILFSVCFGSKGLPKIRGYRGE